MRSRKKQKKKNVTTEWDISCKTCGLPKPIDERWQLQNSFYLLFFRFNISKLKFIELDLFFLYMLVGIHGNKKFTTSSSMWKSKFWFSQFFYQFKSNAIDIEILFKVKFISEWICNKLCCIEQQQGILVVNFMCMQLNRSEWDPPLAMCSNVYLYFKIE